MPLRVRERRCKPPVGSALLALGMSALMLTACASKRLDELDLMPTPVVVDALPASEPALVGNPFGWLLYATDRAPLEETKGALDPDAIAKIRKGKASAFYSNDRGHLVRLGKASIETGDNPIDWEEARRIALLKTRSEDYPLSVSGIEEFGVLDRSYHAFRPPPAGQDNHAPAVRYSELINNKLAASEQKDIYLYVHGFKVIFDNPIVVGAEMWHFMGYEGVSIAYSWPSTPKLLAYFKDSETTIASARHLRVLLEYLAEETDAERIHILGYSQGTRLVAETLYNLALMHHEMERDAVQRKLRIGNVMLVGSDMDAEVFGTLLIDGLTKVAGHLNIYVSDADKALRSAQKVLAPQRLGQDWSDEVTARGEHGLLAYDANMSIIDVSGAEGADARKGHSYLRDSPWVSSDILMAMRYRLTPAERGLVRAPGELFWRFPSDYVDRLEAGIEREMAHSGRHPGTDPR